MRRSSCPYEGSSTPSEDNAGTSISSKGTSAMAGNQTRIMYIELKSDHNDMNPKSATISAADAYRMIPPTVAVVAIFVTYVPAVGVT